MALVFAATLFRSIPVLRRGTNDFQLPAYGNAIAMIRDEGMNRSQIMETLRYLTEVIGCVSQRRPPQMGLMNGPGTEWRPGG